MLRCCCGWTALKNTCCFSTRTVTTTTLGGVGLLVKWLALMETPRCFAFPRSKPFRCWFAGCWFSKIPMKRNCTWQKEFLDWLASGKEIRIDRAPTRWGRISFRLVAMPAEKSLVASVQLSRPGSPKEVHLKLRLPLENKLVKVRINGWVANLRGPGNDTVLIQTQKESRFEVVGEFN